eukprot:scaffold205_cov179-Skeletonema_menzelii.AAC.1
MNFYGWGDSGECPSTTRMMPPLSTYTHRSRYISRLNRRIKRRACAVVLELSSSAQARPLPSCRLPALFHAIGHRHTTHAHNTTSLSSSSI